MSDSATDLETTPKSTTGFWISMAVLFGFLAFIGLAFLGAHFLM